MVRKKRKVEEFCSSSPKTSTEMDGDMSNTDISNMTDDESKMLSFCSAEKKQKSLRSSMPTTISSGGGAHVAARATIGNGKTNEKAHLGSEAIEKVTGESSDRNRDCPVGTSGPSVLVLGGQGAEQSHGIYGDEYFVRIKRDSKAKVNLKWHVLIPKKPRAQVHDMEKVLVRLGAAYPSPEEAARAADKALIAIWGTQDAEEFLNYSSPEYDSSECYRRFGSDLTEYLAGLVEQGQLQMNLRPKRSKPVEKNEYARRLLEIYQFSALTRHKISDLVRSDPTISLQKERCGICRHCRQPWLEMPCIRKKQAQRLGYKYSDHARTLVEGEEFSSLCRAIDIAKSTNNPLENKIRDRMYSEFIAPEITKHAELLGKKQIQEPGTQIEADEIGRDSCTVATNIGPSGGDEEYDTLSNLFHRHDEFTWLQEPISKEKVRLQNKLKLESSQAKFASHMKSMADSKTTTLLLELEKSRKILLEQVFIKPVFPETSPHEEILWESRQASRAGSDTILVRQDDPLWNIPSSYKMNQCISCRMWHRIGNKHCPFYQAANALRKNRYNVRCSHCQGAAEKCLYCKPGVLPDFVQTLKFSEVNWLDKLSPGTKDLMTSIQSLSNAAITDFKMPLLSQRLSAHSLLAFALIAESMIDDQLDSFQTDK